MGSEASKNAVTVDGNSHKTEAPKFVNDNYLMVAAVDFGTTYSAYAFSFRTSPKEILMNKNWGAGVGFESYKAPTCVLTKPNGKSVVCVVV